MKILLSPAKKLNFDKESYPIASSSIQFLEESDKLAQKLKKCSVKKIQALMHLSLPLAELNYHRFQSWKLPFDEILAKPAAFAFDGEVYSGLDVRGLSPEKLIELDQKVIILSGLYGALRPLDAILPYRLEMGTSFAYSSKTTNLYQYWSKKVTSLLRSNLLPQEVLVNLASQEYSKVVDFKVIKNTTVTPIFKEKKADKYQIVMVYAKQARGMMARYLVAERATTLEDVLSFAEQGYKYAPELSTATHPVFVR
jgi:uncharacterized protein